MPAWLLPISPRSHFGQASAFSTCLAYSQLISDLFDWSWSHSQTPEGQHFHLHTCQDGLNLHTVQWGPQPAM